MAAQLGEPWPMLKKAHGRTIGWVVAYAQKGTRLRESQSQEQRHGVGHDLLKQAQG